MFFWSKTAEDEIGVAELAPDGIIAGAKAETGEVAGAEVGDDGPEPVVATVGAGFAVAEGAKGEIEVVAEDENILGRNFIKLGKIADGQARIVVELLGFDKDTVAICEGESAMFGVGLPGEISNFGVKIEGQKAEVVTGKIVLVTGVAETDNKVFHR